MQYIASISISSNDVVLLHVYDVTQMKVEHEFNILIHIPNGSSKAILMVCINENLVNNLLFIYLYIKYIF